MIYVDTSVLLAFVWTEDRRPAREFWDRQLISSRLLRYELWTTLHARRATEHRHKRARAAVRGVSLVEMTPDVLESALQPLPDGIALRTLDNLHLATMTYIRRRGLPVQIASYDHRLLTAAAALGFGIAEA